MAKIGFGKYENATAPLHGALPRQRSVTEMLDEARLRRLLMAERTLTELIEAYAAAKSVLDHELDEGWGPTVDRAQRAHAKGKKEINEWLTTHGFEEVQNG